VRCFGSYHPAMKFQSFCRKAHYWMLIVVVLPSIVVFATGLLLQLKKQLPWVQPVEQRGTGQEPVIDMPQVLNLCRSAPAAGVREWSDIRRIDVRPSRGMMKVWTKTDHEVQIDAGTGRVLQVAYRRSDMIESLHDGSYFGDGTKLWTFLPSGIVLILLWASGVYLFWLPIMVKRRRPRRGEASFVKDKSRGREGI
jgi:uncharacterized iron-regulated membrane protein